MTDSIWLVEEIGQIRPSEFKAFALCYKAEEYVEDLYGPGSWVDSARGRAFFQEGYEDPAAEVMLVEYVQDGC